MLLYRQAIRKNPLHAMKLGDIEYRQHGKVVLLIFHLGSIRGYKVVFLFSLWF